MEKPQQRLIDKFGAIPPDTDALKKFVLEKVRQGLIPEKKFEEDILSRIPPEGPEHIRYCLEVMMVIGVRLPPSCGSAKYNAFFNEILPSAGDISPANHCLLGGLAFGILTQEETDDHEWSSILLTHMLQYEEIVRKLSADECRLLADELRQIFSSL